LGVKRATLQDRIYRGLPVEKVVHIGRIPKKNTKHKEGASEYQKILFRYKEKGIKRVQTCSKCELLFTNAGPKRNVCRKCEEPWEIN
jgi:hypothetical protein